MLKDRAGKVKIMFSGGGTAGSVTPLFAIARELGREQKELEFIFVGTKQGPEKELVSAFEINGQKMTFISLPGGKLRRYFSWRNFSDVFKIMLAWFNSLILLYRIKPNIIVTAGSFVSVPLVWAAYLYRIPILVHQQDVRPGLANRLMAPLARVVTVTFEKSLQDYGPEAVWTGNPFPDLGTDNISAPTLKTSCGLCPYRPLVLVTTGGTGSTAINSLVFSSVKSLAQFAQIKHQTGRGKAPQGVLKEQLAQVADYSTVELVNNEELFKLMMAADLVVARSGLATLTELCALAKPAILIPMPDSHQEDNAAVFNQAGAAIVLNQKELTPDSFRTAIMQVLRDPSRQQELSRNISRLMKRDGAVIIASFINEIVFSKQDNRDNHHDKKTA